MMYAICSLIDGGILRVRLCGTVMCCIFHTEEEAYQFLIKHKLSGRVERIQIKSA